MMSKMKPEDMQRMSQWASKMDPRTMENMMKSMGQDTSGVDVAQMSEQMKNMTPEQLRAGMSEAQNQMGAQKQYVVNGAMYLKNEGNTHIKNEAYDKALEVYNRALENLRPHGGDDVRQLKLALLSNTALCHLKQKHFGMARDTCDQALGLDARAVKPLFRRGQAQESLGNLPEALADVKLAAELSPEDKTITGELDRLRGVCKDKGIREEDIKSSAPPPAAPASGSQQTSSRPASFAPPDAAASSSQPSSMSEAVDRLAKNPEMLQQATDMMKNMNPEDLQRIMQNGPLPPGMDAETMKSRMEAVSQNPDMIKTAMDTLKAMPEEERKRLLSQRGGDYAKMSQMSEMLDNPEMMKMATEMAKNMGNMGDNPDQAEVMRKAAEQLQANPDMGAQMSSMFQNMQPDSFDSMMNDPNMMKAAEEMMKNMSPETLTAMARAQGIEMDEGKAKMMGRVMPYLPYIMKCMHAFSYVKKGWRAAWSPRGRIVLAVIVMLVAVVQYNWW